MTTASRLTAPQLRALDFLYRSGWSSSRAMAKAFYNTRRQAWRAEALIERLAAAGLAEVYHQRTGRRVATWTLTAEGKRIARAQIEPTPEEAPE